VVSSSRERGINFVVPKRVNLQETQKSSFVTLYVF
jgi:hypothetical protein